MKKEIQCPDCGRRYLVDPSVLGKVVKCIEGHRFRAPAPAIATSATAKAHTDEDRLKALGDSTRSHTVRRTSRILIGLVVVAALFAVGTIAALTFRGILIATQTAKLDGTNSTLTISPTTLPGRNELQGVELLLWNVASHKGNLKERQRLLPRQRIPEDNGHAYAIVLVNDFSQYLDLGSRDDLLRLGREQHETLLWPDNAYVSGFAETAWVGQAGADLDITAAMVRLVCASSGTTELTVKLDLFAEDPGQSNSPSIWQATGSAQVNQASWKLYSIPLTPSAPASSAGKWFQLGVRAERDTCKISTGTDGNPHVPATPTQPFDSPAIAVYFGRSVAPGVECGKSAVVIQTQD